MSEERKVILIAGGSGSGKTTLAHSYEHATVLSTDDFYRGISHMNKKDSFEIPTAVNLDEVCQVVEALKAGYSTTVPTYSMTAMDRIGSHMVEPDHIIIVEGIYALLPSYLRLLADETIYIATPRRERIRRRIQRDVERGRNPQQTLLWSIMVEKMHDIFVAPQYSIAKEIKK